jgi:hypothetical protein
VPVAVQGISGATAVSAAGRHACALLAGGTIACWGDGTYGELGNGSRDPAPTPVAVSGVTGATQISAGAYHTCALLSTGIECWGRGVSGQLGTGTDLGELTPAPVSGAAGATAISAGVQTTCATLPGGALSCWGNSQLSPAAVRGLPAAPPTGAQLPPPVFGRSADAQPVSGTVLVRPPGAPAFTPLSAATSLPVGTQIDTTSGRVQLTTAKGTGGRIQSGQFYGGIFTVGQVRTRVAGRRVGLTVLTLSGPLAACGGGRPAAVDKRKPRKRLVWGSAKGDFSTKGKYGSATVRGTRWLVQDSCAGTRVTVASGVVTVSDFARHRTITVRAPHSVLVRRRG